VFVHGWCCFGFSTFSVWPWTDAYNPGEPGGGRRAAPHWQPIPLRSIGCQCGGQCLVRTFTDESLHSLRSNLIAKEETQFGIYSKIPEKNFSYPEMPFNGLSLLSTIK
jgi:hypothetical protein